MFALKRGLKGKGAYKKRGFLRGGLKTEFTVYTIYNKKMVHMKLVLGYSES